jgi:hypothetical protein
MGNSGIFNVDDISYLSSKNLWSGDNNYIEHIETIDMDGNSNEYEFSNFGEYNTHFLTFNDISSDGGASPLRVRVTIDGTIYNNNYEITRFYADGNGGYTESKSTNHTGFEPLIYVASASLMKNHGTMYLYNATNEDRQVEVNYHAIAYSTAINGDQRGQLGAGQQQTDGIVEKLTFTTNNSANLDGQIRIYGVRIT